MLKKEIASLLAKYVALKKPEIENLIEIPPDEKLGDYSFPCFVLAGKLKKSPQEIAKQISSQLEKIKTTKEIQEIKSIGPYINFFVNKEFLAHQILKINENFGKDRKKEKIILEHTSVNPNADPHLGRTRNSIIGDSIKRILEFSGYNVETHYYVNDVSKQVAMLSLIFTTKDNFNNLLKKYIEISKKIDKNPKLERKVFEMLNKLEKKDKKTEKLFKNIVDTAIQGQKRIFSEIGIEFDYFDYESRYLDSSKFILKELEKTGKLFKDKEGRMVLNQAGTGLERSMKFPVLVLTRNDGTGLYPLRDIAYTIDKGKKGRNIIVLGEDQKLYFEQIKQALILLRKPYPEAVHYSYVLINEKGKAKKMSTRRGELVLLSDFLKEAEKKAQQEINKRKTKGNAKAIAIGAVKYSMLKNENNKNIVFDWQQALNFEGDSGPYLQYSCARASSILRKAKIKQKSKTKSKHKVENKKLEKQETELIKKILQFPEIVEHASRQLSPNLIANYSFQLAQIFNEFYHSCKVIGSKEENFRLALVKSFRIVMANSLFLLGIEAIEEM